MKQLDKYAHTAHWFLRIAFISVFLYHGLEKLGDLQGFSQMSGMPIAMAFIVAIFETFGGLLIFAGGFKKEWDLITRIGALLIIPIMLGAIFMVHWGQWSFMATETHPMGGMEFQVTLLFGAVYLFLKGNLVNRGSGLEGQSV